MKRDEGENGGANSKKNQGGAGPNAKGTDKKDTKNAGNKGDGKSGQGSGKEYLMQKIFDAFFNIMVDLLKNKKIGKSSIPLLYNLITD